MKAKAKEISEKVKGTIQSAQKQLGNLEEEIERFIGRIQEKVFTTPVEGAKKLDDLLRGLALREFIEKVRTIEMMKATTGIGKDVLERFGLAARAEVEKLSNRVTELEKIVEDLSKRLEAHEQMKVHTIDRKVASIEKKVKANK